MTRLAVLAALAMMAVSLLGGCGTMVNLRSSCSAYGGLKEDFKFLEESPTYGFGHWMLGMMDLPLTVLGDTITLPIIFLRARDESSAPIVAPLPTARSSNF